MSTLNISMPEAMRDYIETQATRGHYSASEYVRHLIREDQKRQLEEERGLLWEYLALCAQQLDEGDTVKITAAEVLARGRARREQKAS
jgi:antitoxin ParD1/3/4